MNLILYDDDKVFLNKLEIRIRGLSQKHKIAVKMECYVSDIPEGSSVFYPFCALLFTTRTKITPSIPVRIRK